MTFAFGGFFDSVLDRYADILVILGLTLWSEANEAYPGIWLIGFLAAKPPAPVRQRNSVGGLPGHKAARDCSRGRCRTGILLPGCHSGFDQPGGFLPHHLRETVS